MLVKIHQKIDEFLGFIAYRFPKKKQKNKKHFRNFASFFVQSLFGAQVAPQRRLIPQTMIDILS